MKLATSLSSFIWKVSSKSRRLSLYFLYKVRSWINPTYSDRDWGGLGKLRVTNLPLCQGALGKAIHWADEVMEHTFDLLGSGKVKVRYGLDAKGLEGYKYPPLEVDFEFDDRGKWLKRFINKSNLVYAQKVWRLLKSINPFYEPIDWQLDFKSGYRWANSTFYMDVRYGHERGADVKMPWELSRFQHLSALATGYKVSGQEKYALEYVSQILDWIATNPPMFGVNWKCTMDVAIRVTNWLFWLGCIRIWLERQEWKDEFYRIFSNSVYDHLKFIRKNLEWNPIFTTNHYLSNVAGLLILSSATENVFPQSSWLRKIAIEKLKQETLKQVNPDGTDYEGSTCYHRLALELIFYPVWWEVIRHGRFDGKNYREVALEIFGEVFVDRLYRMFVAVLYLLKPNGRMPQIGDNDNGQFIKLYPRDILDMRYLLALGGIFFNEQKFKVAEFFRTEEDIVEIGILFGNRGFESWSELYWNELANVGSKALYDSGWYIIRDGLNYIIVSCVGSWKSRPRGHAHDDRLSFELVVNGRDIVVDPGTFVYTALPELRNRFRSAAYHNTFAPVGLDRSGWWDTSKMSKIGGCRCLEFDGDGGRMWFEGEYRSSQEKVPTFSHKRRIVWDRKERKLTVHDKVLWGSVSRKTKGNDGNETNWVNILTIPEESGRIVTNKGSVRVEKGYRCLAYGRREEARRIFLSDLDYSIQISAMDSTFDEPAEASIFLE